MAEEVTSTLTRRDKVRLIFDRFDANADGGLDRSEMAALVAAVNPTVPFTPDQTTAIIDEVFRSYSDFIPDPSVGLTLLGLLHTYDDDGAGDVDRDFAALDLSPSLPPSHNPASSRRISPAWVSSPNHGIARESTWKAVEELEVLIRSRIRSGKLNRSAKDSILFDGYSENGWSMDLSLEIDRKRAIVRDDRSREFRAFLKELKEIRARIDREPTREAAFDGHLAVGRTLYERRLFPEALESFRRAAELMPDDVRARYRIGNTLVSLGRSSEAKGTYLAALELAEEDSVRWSELLPQIHVNLGIVTEEDGLLINASEHYREAAILCPTHYRALKLLGSALFGVGEYGPAERALEEAVLLKPDFADAHCDLGAVLHAAGEEERAILAFQRAIDLRADHLDALYNLGGVFKDAGRYQRAAEMYGRVLAVRPAHWRAQLNRAVSLVGAGEEEQAKKALNEAFKTTNRVELYEAIRHLNQLQREKAKDEGMDWVVVDPNKFKQANEKTTERKHLANALWIRALQKSTKLGRCSATALKKQMEAAEASDRSVRKAGLEAILRKLLHFLKPDAFRGAVKAIDGKIWAVLDAASSGKIDLGMFFAVVAPLCAGSPERRKRAAFDALLWRPEKGEAHGQVAQVDAASYLRYLRVIFFPSEGLTELTGIRGGEEGDARLSFAEFADRFDDTDCGFGMLGTLLKLESGDRVARREHYCGVCRYRISGLMFREASSRLRLCSFCYSECKVPCGFEREEYKFRECVVK